ncbi:hypothetical protein HMPREF1246_0886 [Acidaminococcus sp. BV3L6]|nr:hypothetical protein HMPREF1246_0886 [Acidaminococcus sp. BV3L6]
MKKCSLLSPFKLKSALLPIKKSTDHLELIRTFYVKFSESRHRS